jgi:hypothetical protein
MTEPPISKRTLVVCVQNQGYEASLERRKIYVSIDDDEAQARNLLRVVDESGDDYLFPAKMFIAVELPQPVQREFLTTA